MHLKYSVYLCFKPLNGGIHVCLQQPTISRKTIFSNGAKTRTNYVHANRLVANRSNKWIRDTTRNSVAVGHKINNDRIGGYRDGR